MNVFVTGSTRGLGAAFVNHFMHSDATVYGIGRSALANTGYHYRQVDVADFDALQKELATLFENTGAIDLLILNAGVLGHIRDTSQCSMQQLKYEMDVNMWANKVILDFFIHNAIPVRQVIAISSGASINGSLGWNGYSLSKAALNMLIKLYAAEMTDTHLCALAPGLVKTKMLNGILHGNHDTTRYTSVQTLRESEDAGIVLPPETVVEKIMEAMPKILKSTSGAFLDIRNLT